ncbi:MAG: glutamate 5-kinase [Clostridiales bacterium]|nr:glutamate 5-kinase [Clostridiales bacterium]
MDYRQKLKDKKRIVIKIGSSSLTHNTTGGINLQKLEKLVRTLCDLKNQGKDIVLVSSGAIAVGKNVLRLDHKLMTISEKQACAAIGQANLMLIYQKLFSEYTQVSAQILMTKDTVVNNLSRYNAKNTFEELFKMGVIPIVNENDTVSTYEIQFGDNDRLSAIVTGLIGADLLILLSDIDGLFTDDPKQNPDAKFIDFVPELSEELLQMGKDSSSSNVGTGGMSTKLMAAKIATDSGADMVIANGEDLDVIHEILNGKKIGTLFAAHKENNFNLIDYLED